MNEDIPGRMFNPRYPLFDLQIVNFAPANEREKSPTTVDRNAAAVKDGGGMEALELQSHQSKAS